ncbi:acetyl-CoA synthetase-like protein [Xylariaceae sp. FL1651]|nr:acetyl-CoA synthetase-like protein [Xylariaceae sp. FL1651]
MPHIDDSSSSEGSPVLKSHLRLEDQSDYWKKQLAGSKPAELFHDKNRPVSPSGQIDVQEVTIPPSTLHALRRFCDVNQTSSLSVLLAAIRAAHYRLTGVEDAVLGVSNWQSNIENPKDSVRQEIRPIRLQIQDESFLGLVKHVSSTLADAETNRDGIAAITSHLQLDKPCEAQAFRTILKLHSRNKSHKIADKTMKARQLNLGYELEFHLHEGEGYSGHVVFSEDIYHPKTINTMVHILNRTLDRGIHKPETSITLLDLGDESSEFYSTLPQAIWTDYPRQASIVDVFRSQVTATPNALAVKDDTTQMTYVQLDQISDSIALSLILRGLPAETLIAVFAPRSIESIVAFIGILKADLAYIPLDVDAPAARIETILSSGNGCALVLLGSGLEAPVMRKGPDWIRIADSMQHRLENTHGLGRKPSAHSLAYVIFTSGSTGKPKGVMMEHRGVVRLVKNTNWMTTQDTATNVAHMSNLAFDAATLEIFAPLLNGGTLICFPKKTVLDNQALCRAFAQERIGFAFFTTALFRLCLAESPDTLRGLHHLSVGGEKMDVRDARHGCALIRGKFFNMYGPTENTVYSTQHRIRAEENYVNGVSIGRTVSNSGAYVVDAQLRPVPVGVMGELVVTGDGLARGYVDARQNRDRFIQMVIDGRLTRAYRTGDYVRYRPADHELEFWGRIDFQVKIRGNRVELSEIEHVFLGHESISEAVALPYKRNGVDMNIVGFVTILDSEDPIVDDQEYEDTEVESQQVEVWKDLFDTDKYVGIDMLEGEHVGRDFTSWTSMYDGKLIDNNDMEEWLDDTIRSILDGKPAGRVLEVGTGTGMILFNITEGLESYLGLDPAPSAVALVNAAAARFPDIAEKARVMVGTALDVGRIRDLNSPELVIVNSVAQYFPSPKYFLKAIEDFAQLPSTRRLYLGDIRSSSMFKQFQASKALHLLGDDLTKDDMRRRIRAAERVEEELLLDPSFFTSLSDLFPQLVGHVEILPKRMVATNELSCYRYAAVVHLNPKLCEPALHVHEVPPQAWLDFSFQNIDAEKLEKLLRSTDQSLLAVANIPFSKTILERLVIESLETDKQDISSPAEWLSSIRDASKQTTSLAPIDLERLATKTGFHVEISWARQYSLHGGLDAVFHKGRSNGARTLFRFPTDHAGRPFRTLSSHPLRRRRIQAIERELQIKAISKLPSYMVPNLIHVLENMPINANGKIDRRALAAIASDLMIDPMLSLKPGGRQPEGAEELYMQKAWASVLGLDPTSISAHHNFLELGGDSIHAMRLVGFLRRQGFSLTVAQILSTPLLCDLALQLQRSTETQINDVQAFSLLPTGTDPQETCRQAASALEVPVEAIHDILPCTPLQEGLVAMTDRRHGAYVVRHIFELRPTVDENRFRQAWEQVVQTLPILRTRLVDVPGLGIMQAVLSGEVKWHAGVSIEEYLVANKKVAMGIATPLRHEALIHEHRRLFVLTIHHALHDGWAMRLILDALHQAYQGELPSDSQPFERFIKYVHGLNSEDTSSFWRKELEGVEALHFPRLPSPSYHPEADRVVTKTLKGVRWANKEFTGTTAVRAALAVLLAAYNNSTDVVYGVTLAGRQAPIAGIEEMVGPTFATVPVRVLVDVNARLEELLRRVQQQATDMGPFEQVGLQNIRRLSAEMSVACGFQTLLVVQPEIIIELASSEVFIQQLSSDSFSGSQMNLLNTYALMFEVALGSEGIRISMSHDTTVIDEDLAQLVLDQFACILRRLSTMVNLAEMKVSDLTHVGEGSLQRIWSWNGSPRAVKELIVHDIFNITAVERRDMLAVCAWDGDFTFRDLDQLSTSLAHHLVDLGIGPGFTVPLCFERSKWACVAMLGVLKTGGAFVLLDIVNETVEALRAIAQHVKSPLILSSQAKYEVARQLGENHNVCICNAASSRGWQIRETPLPTVRPEDALYVTFSTDSCRIKEGIVITHSNFTSTFEHQRNILAITPASRILDMRIPAPDIALYAFCSGACLCIPSDWDRTNSLPNVIPDLAVNYAQLTPTEARCLDRTALDSIQTIQFVGEPIRQSLLSQINPSTKCIGVYTSPVSCGAVAYTTLSVTNFNSTLSVNTNVWVTDTADTARLAIPGSIGELCLEGPSIGYAYGETGISFDHDPQWLLQGGPGPDQLGRHGRLYKTRDFARYCPNGGLELMSYGGIPVDAKVKGEYIDLGQVEDAVFREFDSLGTDRQGLHVIADLANLNGDCELVLVLYVVLPSVEALSEDKLWAALSNMVARLGTSMTKILPSQTLPAAYIPLKSLPITATGTPDRQALRDIAASLPAYRLKSLSDSQVPHRMPTTTQEKQLRDLWAAVLNFDASKIGVDDSFLQLGGDSVLAMRLVAKARRSGLSIKTAKRRAPEYTAPLSLLSSTIDRAWARSQAALICDIEVEKVQDLFPCTPLQEGLIAITEQRRDQYVARVSFPLPPSIDPDRFVKSWAQTVAAVPILRTRIVDLLGQGLVQVIVDEEGSCPHVYEEPVENEFLGLGTRLCHASLVGTPGDLKFRLVIHHSLYDGWSLPLIMNFVNELYNGHFPEKLISFQGFIRYTQGVSPDDTARYWRGQFEGSEAVVFPPLPTPNYQFHADSTVERTIDAISWPSQDITPASVVRAAWALLQARYTDSPDSVFGSVVTGRQAPVTNIERIAGPTLATVPIRVKINGEATIRELLKQVHIQAADMIPFEQTGLQRIRQLGNEADQCTRFQVLLVIQPPPAVSDEPGNSVITEYIGQGQADEYAAFNSYALMLVCDLSESGLKIRMSHDSHVIDATQGQRMLAQLEQILRQLLTPGLSSTRVEEISTVSSSDLDEIWAWNAEPLKVVETSVLDAIAAVVHTKAKEIAISAWDGELTFEQLDLLSTRLAQYMSSLNIGIGPGAVLILHFEKSMWMPVAMVAALKTGAASVTFDATLPAERLFTIIEQVKPKLVLSSAGSAIKIANLKTNLEVLLVSQKNIDDLPQITNYKQVQINPNDPLCIVFTSGSTGQPKGSVLTHKNFSSAMETHAKAYGLGTTCFRLYDFTSYNFDFAWSALLLSLSQGVTVCVPSEAERKGDIIASIARYRADFVCLTPSLVRTLDFSRQSTLRTLVVGGEPFTAASAPPMDAKIRLVSVYGPSECTVCATGNNVSKSYIGSLGRGYNTNTWIVDPSNSSRLVPIGCTGELWLEGPLVGQGYFQEPEKTAAAFIKDASWLLKGHAGWKGRSAILYKTGDLVKYMSDGSLEFVGRRDGQVKIRGQRVEFGEIEYNLRRLLGSGETGPQLVVDYVTLKGMPRPTLAVFVVPHTAGRLTEDEMWALVDSMASDDINERLAETLPSYMIPTAYIAMPSLPMTATGKVDRRHLRQVASTSSRVAGQRSLNENDLVDPANEIECTLRSVWAQVLNCDEESLSVEKGFNHLGGDSISAMQVVSRCRTQNLYVTVADILKSQTIRRLSHVCKIENSASREIVSDDASIDEHIAWGLSPIQKMFFAGHASGNDHFNQSFILKTRTPISLLKLQDGLEALVARHSMLRARFMQSGDGHWTQQIGPLDGGVILKEHHVDKRSNIAPIAQRAQRGLDIRTGKVFTVDVFDVEDNCEQVVLFTAHHLVVDLVSWRIIWFDLEAILAGAQLSKPKLSFCQWCKIQEADADTSQSLSVPDTLPQHSYWGITPEGNTEGSIKTTTRHLEADVASLILGDSNLAFGTEPLDILLSVLAHTFSQVFNDRSAAAFYLEGHGREPIEDMDFDLSETVGWFTVFQPVQLTSIAGDNTYELVRRNKDLRARIPGKGRSYLASRCYNSSYPDPYPVAEDIEVLVNYTGRFQQLEAKDGLFTRLDGAEGDIILEETSPHTRRFGILGITIEIINDQLVISLGYNKSIRYQDRLNRWLDAALADLRAVAPRLAHMAPRPTLADYPLLDISYKDLDNLFDVQFENMQLQKSAVRDIYPCTALQEGIIHSQEAGIASYVSYWIWSCLVTEAERIMPVDPKKLQDAWNLTLARHGMFSTVFVNHPATGRHLQVLLLPREDCVERIHRPKDSPEEFLKALRTPEFPANSPAFSVKVVSGLDGQVACRLDVSHALMDAAAMTALLRDLAVTFEGKELIPATQFKTVAAHILKIPELERLQYWTEFLHGVAPCCVSSDVGPAHQPEMDSYVTVGVKTKSSTKLHEFCTSRGITRATFLQVVWAMVLSRLTGMDIPCFGYLASGRDLPIVGVDGLVAPLINMLVGKVDLTANLDHVLTETNNRSVEHMAHQHVSLADIQHELGLGGQKLFDTAVSVRDMHLQEGEHHSLQLKDVAEGDPTEFDLLLTAGVDGSTTMIELIYRQSTLNGSAAAEVLNLLESAIDFVVSERDSNVQSTKSVSLRSAFFQAQVGTGEDTATAYWETALAGLDATKFPHFPSPTCIPRVDSATPSGFLEAFRSSDNISMSAILRAAWGLLLSRYSGDSDVVFNTATSQRSSVARVAAIPAHVAVDGDMSRALLLHATHKDVIESSLYERVGLNRIRRISEDASRCCQGRSLLYTHTADDTVDSDVEIRTKFHSYALVIECELQRAAGVRVRIHYSSELVGSKLAQRILDQFLHVLPQISDADLSNDCVGSLSIASPADIADVWQWNAHCPKYEELCVHDTFSQTARFTPHAPAIHAWDGELTYGQLDSISTRLANHLVNDLHVGLGDIVPLIFEKSRWTPVAMLAVMKTGAASVVVDITQPEERLSLIIQQTKSAVILTSEAGGPTMRRLNCSATVIMVSRSLMEKISEDSTQKYELQVKPDQPLCVVFTSGSTGIPKGAVLTHRNWSSALPEFATVTHLTPKSRVFDFAAYSFDMVWANLLLALYTGSCLCIPSESDRQNNLVAALQQTRATFVFLTPSLAVTLDLSPLAGTLETLALGGEAVRKQSILPILKLGIRVIDWYGPAENTVMSTFAELTEDSAEGTIGRGVATNTWVVQRGSDARGQLCGIGEIGELCLEGPLVAAGYLNDAVRTAAFFIQDPVWLLNGGTRSRRKGRSGSVYRTGDLVKQCADGSLVYMGREDAQVKIRGQRVELGEIEHHIRQELLSGIRVAVDMVTLPERQTPTLAAFIAPLLGDASSTEQLRGHLTSTIASVSDRLSKLLPSYMCPAVYIQIHTMPLTGTNKLDRRRLRQLGASCSADQAIFPGDVQPARRTPQTPTEKQLQNLWASLLGIDINSISADDSFFHVGGDSIAAMRLVVAARNEGLNLRVSDIMQRPRLCELAERLSVAPESACWIAPGPFSLLPFSRPREFVDQHIVPAMLDPSQDISDVFPTSWSQRDFITGVSDAGPLYSPYVVVELPEMLEEAHLEKSCSELVRAFDILRTVFVQTGETLLQVVLADLDVSLEHAYGGNFEVALKTLRDHKRGLQNFLGRSPLRFMLLSDHGNQRWLAIRISHAQYDGISLPAMMSALGEILNGSRPANLPSFSNYMKHVAARNPNSYAFWRTLLQSSAMTAIRQNTEAASATSCDKLLVIEDKLQMSVGRVSSHSTPASYFTACCAKLLSRLSQRGDVVFGRVVSGRSGLEPQLENTAGPCTNTIPVRVINAQGGALDTLASQIQQQFVDSASHETVGFDEILEHCVTWPRETSEFGMIVKYQNIDNEPALDICGCRTRYNFHIAELPIPRNDTLRITGVPVGPDIKVSIDVTSAKFSEDTLLYMLRELQRILDGN